MVENQPHDLPKGVVFTHVAMKPGQADSIARSQDAAHQFSADHVPFLAACLQCANLRLVYIYVDLGLRSLKIDEGGKSFTIGGGTAALENFVIGSLRVAESRARRLVAAASLQFEYVGLSNLASLLTALIDIDPLLVKPIAGSAGLFTYDSPKFIEAVIRLARGVDPSLCRQPILRMDGDVLPNPQSIDAMLSKAQEELRQGTKYFFFSGGYRGEDIQVPDPVNQHAVRTHWLSDRDGCNRFLGDLGVVGATQLTLDPKTEWGFLPAGASGIPRSEEGERLAGAAQPRRSPQAISGAGLVMSFCCILELPPFLRTPYMVVWIDDHLKRRLHESLNHIGHIEPEALPEARFLQKRDGDRDWARHTYFDRLFRGCLMHALIVTENGEAGVLAEVVARAVRGQIRRHEPTDDGHELFDRAIPGPCDKQELLEKFEKEARKQGERVSRLWRESRQAYGDELLADWVENPVLRDEKGQVVRETLDWVYKTTAEDAYRYLVLVTEWWDYVRAILRLERPSAWWLFE